MLFIISVFLEFGINIKRENHWARSILFHREVELTFFLIIPKPEIETTGYKKQASTSTQGYAIKLQRFLCRIKVNVYFLNPYAKSYTIRVKRIDFVTANCGILYQIGIRKVKKQLFHQIARIVEYKPPPETYFELLYLMNVPTIKQSLMSNDNEKIHLIKRLLLIKIPSWSTHCTCRKTFEYTTLIKLKFS